MVIFADFETAIASGESETLELKATTGQRTEAARTLSAMLNGQGGTVIFGVQPNGSVVGISIDSPQNHDA